MGFLHRGSSLSGARRRERAAIGWWCRSSSIRHSLAPARISAGYPRDFERDCELLEAEGVDVLFHPSVDEMYPQGGQTHVEVEKLSLPLCGASRPGHFRGVATVVTKLFNIVLPHVAVFGEKDYQQLQVIRRLVRDLSMGVEIIGHPIVREADGLAMSSRNAYLSATERAAAVCLSRALCRPSDYSSAARLSARVLVRNALAELEKEPLAKVEYVRLCDAETLDEIEVIDDAAVLALAVRIGKARLIDNRVLQRSQGA